MSIYALTGKDTIIINNIPLNDFADGDIGTVDIPNDIFTLQTGKDGNTIFALDESGSNATLTVRLIASSADDKRLNGLIPQSENFASTVLLTGSLVKMIGDGQGNISLNSYVFSGGMIQKLPNLKTNVNGDVAQAVVEYSIKFAKAGRVIS